jgi:septum formation protein
MSAGAENKFAGLPPLILASASPRRGELLRQCGIEFQVVPSDYAETGAEQLTPQEICLLHAYHKARAVAKRIPDALVLGADTVVCLGAQAFGKPADYLEAGRMLRTLQGRTHQVVTGVCLLHLRSHREQLFAESTQVTLRPLTEHDIRQYHAAVNPLDKAGAYAIQERAESIVESVTGSLSNVIGLPLEKLEAALAAWTSA